MSTTIFTGCSYTSGIGFDGEQNDPKLWTNIFHENNRYLRNTVCVNLGARGAANEHIFNVSINALLDHKPAYAFVEWTDYPRYTVLLGLETYNSTQTFTPNNRLYDHQLHTINYSAQYLEKVRNRFLALHHPHQGIYNIVKYINTLINIAKITDTKIFFINGLCEWDKDYFTCLENVLPNMYTPYTQKILDVVTRNDQEISKLYNNIHLEYQQAGGIHENHWLNLYSSMQSMQIDTNDDNLHPGEQSNKNYAILFEQTLIEKLSS